MDRQFWATLWAISTVASLIIVFGWVLLGKNESEDFT